MASNKQGSSNSGGESKRGFVSTGLPVADTPVGSGNCSAGSFCRGE
jgi:hypothetical protein